MANWLSDASETSIVDEIPLGGPSPSEMLQKYDRGVSKHIFDVVTVDELCIYVYEPESQQQLTEWVFQDEPNSYTKHIWLPFFSKKLDLPQSYH